MTYEVAIRKAIIIRTATIPSPVSNLRMGSIVAHITAIEGHPSKHHPVMTTTSSAESHFKNRDMILSLICISTSCCDASYDKIPHVYALCQYGKNLKNPYNTRYCILLIEPKGSNNPALCHDSSARRRTSLHKLQ
jgi:hypothetical protein